MYDEIEEKAVILPPFKHFIMTVGEIPTSYLESMTYYEMLVWFTNYLGKTVIPAINENGEAVIELQNLFVRLQNYVNDYFDNLDVQEEINNKLDAMTQSGELTSIIKNYVDPIYQAYENEINLRVDTLDDEITTYETQVNSSLNTLNNRITNGLENIISGAPRVVSSTSDMTDTSKIYVNSTNGKWYYYDGDSWEIGGDYQAAEDSQTVTNLSNNVNNLNDKVGITPITSLDGHVYDQKAYDVYGDRVTNNATIATDIFNVGPEGLIESSIDILGYVYWDENNIPTRVFSNVTNPIIVTNDIKKIALMYQKSHYTLEEVEEATVTNIFIENFNLQNEINDINLKLNGGIYQLKTLKNKCLDNMAYSVDGILYQNTGTVTTKIFNVEPNDIIETEKVILMVATWDVNNEFTRTEIHDRMYTIPNNVVKIALIYSKGNFNDIENQKCNGLYDYEDGLINEYETVNVGSGKEYESVIEAFKYISSLNKKAVINIYEGDYDIYDELGGDDFVTAIINPSNWSEILPTFTKEVKIIGHGNVKLNLLVPDEIFNNYNYQAMRLSIINCKSAIHVENITFNCENCRYAIHDECDNNTSFDYTNHLIKNCRFIMSKTLSGIGIGMSSSVYEIDNCYIKNTHGNSIYMHNWNTNTGNSITIKDTIIDATNDSIKLGINGTALCNISIKSSFVKKVQINSENISVYTNNCYQLYANNVDFNNVTIQSGVTNTLNPVIK